MADQMREARRRRIIENSEKRLQRILGVTTNNDEGNAVKFFFKQQTPTQKIFSFMFSEPERQQTELPTNSPSEFTSRHQNVTGNIVTSIDPVVVKEEAYPRQRVHLGDGVVKEVTNPIKSTQGILGTKSLFELDEITANLNDNKINPEQSKNWAGLLVLLAITSITILYTNFGVFIGNVRLYKEKYLLYSILTIMTFCLFITEYSYSIWDF